MEPRNQVIVVTGMHRSGTSMISNLIAELGHSFGDPTGFYGADRWNAKGYYEQTEIIDVNARIITGLRRCGPSWQRHLGNLIYATMPSRRAMERRAAKQRPELDRLAGRYAGLALKDPRFCLTLGAWRAVAPVDRVVVCIRHPASVARSLQRRQRFPLGRGHRFWTWHLKSLLRDLEGLEVLAVDFDRLASRDCGEELEQIRRALAPERGRDEVEALHARIFDAGLRHFEPPGEEGLPADTVETWRALRALHADSLARQG